MKDELRRIFSVHPEKYYKVELFSREGFIRKACKICGRFFWTLDDNKNTCPEAPCQNYEFIGNPPTSHRFDYIETWKVIEDFFTKNGHKSIKKYPVVCRWRPDLFFTVASIIDFQRIEGGKLIFELPANPLVIPQMCLRFNDIENVGITGKHYTSFCMIGQHSIHDHEGYWKDKCIELDYELLTGPFGISPKDIIFLEDVWLGYGAFGYSIEYHVKGLELGNAVFTEFEGTPSNYRKMNNGVIDMGAGLERFTWITQGTPTSYDCVFGPIIELIVRECKFEYDREFFNKFSRFASSMNFEISGINIKNNFAKKLNTSVQDLDKKILPIVAIYSIADHARSLVFAIADGALPSNVGGGYNLRVILRRALELIEKWGWRLNLSDVANWHISYLKLMYPEIEEHQNEILKIIEVEEERYKNMKDRTNKIMNEFSRKHQTPSEEELIKLYDSDGITPEQLLDRGFKINIPHDFYGKITARHSVPHKTEEIQIIFDVENLPSTKLLFYENQNLVEFKGKIIRIFEKKYIILDQTAFYPRSGGQEPDTGQIEDYVIKDVVKVGNIIFHDVGECNLKEGEVVSCKIDKIRRGMLMRHHTATHIINGAARRVLGSWVWQHSAYKEQEKARIDITHYAQLSRNEIIEIEQLANHVVQQNIPVHIMWLPRNVAELRYGFRLYQGGVVPSRKVRVIDIENWDVECCGGTHCSYTGEIGIIKILKSERIQDGVVRIEFSAGKPGIIYVEQLENSIIGLSSLVGSQQNKVVDAVSNLKTEIEELRTKNRLLLKRLSLLSPRFIIEESTKLGNYYLYITPDESLESDFHISVGQKSTDINKNLVYCAFINTNQAIKVLVFCGKLAQDIGIKASEIVKYISNILGGSGGGNLDFGQGGGTKFEKIDEAKKALCSMIKKIVNSNNRR